MRACNTYPSFASALTLSSLLLVLMGCGSTRSSVSNPAPTTRTYNGTASVGDFLNITVDPTMQTITYTDVSNHTNGSATYTVNGNGTYALSDPTGNLIGAYEVPNYMLLVEATQTGPNSDTPALITAVESGPISLSTFEAQNYNTMQFRTAAGGLEAGSIDVTSQGTGSISSYWPFGSYNQGGNSHGPFNSNTINFSEAQEDPSGTYLTVPDPDGTGSDYVFGTANGVFAVDLQSGALLGLAKAASKDFDPSVAGTYTVIFYQKLNASTGAGNVETGTPSLGNATAVVGSDGQLSLTDSHGNQLATGTLTAVADTPYLYGGAGELTDPCDGLFTLRVTTANAQQDFFVSFQGQAMLFSSFTANLPWNDTYNYFYGVGLN